MNDEKAWQLLELFRETAGVIQRLEQRVAALELDVKRVEREMLQFKLLHGDGSEEPIGVIYATTETKREK